MKKKNLILVIVFIVFSLNSSFSKEYTSWNLTADLYTSNIFYASDFKQIPNVPNTSPGFKFAYGFNYGAKIGIEYISNTKLFSFNPIFGLGIGYSFLNAKYSVENMIGYDIKENTYEKLITQNDLSANIPYLFINPTLSIKPLSIPLRVGLGFEIGLPSSPNFEQSENLLNKDRYFETGTNQRDVFSGALPNYNPIYLAVNLDLKYKVKTIGSFDFYPNISLNYALTNLVKDLDWKAHSVKAGLNIAYKIPKQLPKPEPPKAPIKLELPLPQEKAKDFKLDIYVYANNDIISNKVIDLVIIKNYNYLELLLPNELYYNQNQISNLDVTSESFIASVAEKMKNDKNLRLTLIAKTPDLGVQTESDEILNKRLVDILNKLSSYGVNKERISSKLQTIKEEFKYTQLADEYRNITLETNDNKKLFETRLITSIDTEVKKANLKIEPLVTSDAGIKEFVGTVISPLKEKDYADFNQKGVELFLDESFINYDNNNGYSSEKLSIMATATDNDNVSIKKEINLEIRPITSEKYTKNLLSNNRSDMFVVGFSRFDKPDFYCINDSAKIKIQNALKNGKKVYLTASTDDLGDKIYNTQLAEKRFKNALSILGINESSVEKIIKINNELSRANDRVITRGVYAEIEK